MNHIFKLWTISCYLSTYFLIGGGNTNFTRNSTNSQKQKQQQQEEVATGQQHVKIAGLFSIHLKENGKKCSHYSNPTNYQMVEAMKFAVQQINNNNALLPSVTLDYVINDTCGIVKNSVQALLCYSFVTKYFERNDTCDGTSGNVRDSPYRVSY